MTVEQEEYGYVVVTKGRLKDKVAYYDDDASPKSAVIYTGAFADGYYVVPRSWLRPATDLEERRHIKAGHAVNSRYTPKEKSDE